MAKGISQNGLGDFFMEVGITAIGIANPEYCGNQAEVAEFMAREFRLDDKNTRRLKAIYRASGIQKRYSVIGDYCKAKKDFTFFSANDELIFPSTKTRMEIYKKNALPLALNAIEDCFSELEDGKEFDKNTITHVITISCTGMYAPGLDIEIVQSLRLSQRTERICINFMGCYGAFNGMKVADAICRANKRAKVLVVSIELCSIHIQKGSTLDDLVAGAIFSDGAAAILVESEPKQKKFFSFRQFCCNLLPKGHQDMTWAISDHGFDIVLSSYVPELIESGIKEFAEQLLNDNNLQLKEIDIFAIHPGGKKILEACEKSLDISKDQNQYAYEVLRNYGNMSSATILFLLKRIWNEMNKKNHGNSIFSCAFGPGITLESLLLKVQHA
jgi:alpha-pyrone synthase